MRKKILVVSHERSGTHFLMNSICLNFGFDMGWIDVFARDSVGLNIYKAEKYKKNIEKFMLKNWNSNSNKIYKSHHQVVFFEKYIEKLLELYCVFYIVRDPRDTIVSCYHYFHKARVSAFPIAQTVKDLMFNIQPYNYPFDGAYSLIKSDDFLTRWITHVSGWLKYCHRVKVIKFSDLKNDFQVTIDGISEVVGTSARKPLVVPDLKTNTVSPRKGVEGDWENYINDDDNKNICKKVESAGLGEFLVEP